MVSKYVLGNSRISYRFLASSIFPYFYACLYFRGVTVTFEAAMNGWQIMMTLFHIIEIAGLQRDMMSAAFCGFSVHPGQDAKAFWKGKLGRAEKNKKETSCTWCRADYKLNYAGFMPPCPWAGLDEVGAAFSQSLGVGVLHLAMTSWVVVPEGLVVGLDFGLVHQREAAQ